MNEATTTETGIVKAQQPIIVFKGKLVGDLEETVITPALITEKSKPLLALKINGIFDTEGAEKVKEAILKAVKMRTLVEKQADPLIKSINAQAKKDVQSVKDLAQPIYDACLKTQNELQSRYDAWQTEVNKAKAEEQEKHRAKTEGRENRVYELGLSWNGQSFFGYGKIIGKAFLFDLDDAGYDNLVTELAGLQMQAGLNPTQPAKAPEPIVTGTTHYIPVNKTIDTSEEFKPFDNTIYERYIYEHGVHIFITNGKVPEHPAAAVQNDQIKESGYFLQVLTR